MKEDTQVSKILLYVGKAIPTKSNPDRVIMVAMDGDTGEVIRSHHSTNVKWGLEDMGYVVVKDNKKCTYARQFYSEVYPNGYIIEYLGNLIPANKRILELVGKQVEIKKVVKTKAKSKK